MNDVEALKMNPHGMAGIGQPAVSESVSGEQVAELVMVARLGNTEDGEERDSNYDHTQSHG